MTPFVPLGASLPRPKVLRRYHNPLALSVRPKLDSKRVQQPRSASSQEPLSSIMHVPRLVDLEGGTASTHAPSSSWGEPAPRMPLTDAAEAAQPTGDVSLPSSLTEVSRKRSREPEPERAAAWHVVQHLSSSKLHMVRLGADRAVCTWWTCGTPEAPAPYADYSAVPSRDLDWCSRCFEQWDRKCAPCDLR